MYESLLAYFRGYTDKVLTEDEINLIRNLFSPKKFRKRQYFLQEGEVCKNVAFIIKGAMRQYSVDDKGQEHIIKLYIENWWANDRESLMKQIPSNYFIDAWEDTEVLLITKNDLTELVENIPALAEWHWKLDVNFAIASERRLNAAISLSAEDRYHELEKAYPEFLQRFPQHIIASYLGIKRETLSRIRGRGIKK